MDPGKQPPPPAGRRKPKFKPKDPPRRKLKPEVNDANDNEEEAAIARKLMTKFNENLNLKRKNPKVEKKSVVQATFGDTSTVSTSLRKYGVPDKNKNVTTDRTGTTVSTNDNDDETAKADGSIKYFSDEIDKLSRKIKKDYREPWDYNTYYPTTLPLRRPYSGDPELLNEVEFREASRKSQYNEKNINAASDLGLLEESDKEKLFFFKLPPILPIVKRSASARGKEKVEGLIQSHSKGTSMKGRTLDDLPKGLIGKIQVYKSGAMKMKLGDILYDVSPGIDCSFAQDAMYPNFAAKECLKMGQLQKHVVATPNVDSLLDSITN